VSVTPGTTYTLSAWGKKNSTLANLMLFVKGYGGVDMDRYFTTTSYSQNSITFKPTNSTCLVGVWAWDGSGSGYADDFVLTSSSPTPTPTPNPAVSNPKVTLAWNAVPDGQLPIAGYKLYAGPSSGAYTQIFDLGRVTTIRLVLVDLRSRFYAITAYNAAGESGKSNEIRYP
jgi:hypothetical protein